MKLLALGTIVRRDEKGVEESISAGAVFDSKGGEANDLRNLGSAREATDAEIAAAAKLKAASEGQASVAVEQKPKSA